MARAHIPYPQLLAAALRELGQIPYDHAKLMSAEQVISLFVRDHGILHATDPIDEHWNITWRLIAPHREKSKRDTAIVAKSKRIRRKEAAHKAAVQPLPYRPINWIEVTGNLGWKPKRKIPSRPFPKKKRKLRAHQ